MKHAISNFQRENGAKINVSGIKTIRKYFWGELTFFSLKTRMRWSLQMVF